MRARVCVCVQNPFSINPALCLLYIQWHLGYSDSHANIITTYFQNFITPERSRISSSSHSPLSLPSAPGTAGLLSVPTDFGTCHVRHASSFMPDCVHSAQCFRGSSPLPPKSGLHYSSRPNDIPLDRPHSVDAFISCRTLVSFPHILGSDE